MQIQSDVGIHVGWVQTFNPFVGENKNVILKEVFESISSTFMKKTIIINTLLFNNFMELPGFIVIKIIEYARKYDTFVYVIVNENIEKVSYEQLKNAGAMLMLTASPEDVQQKSFFRLLAGAIAGNELEKNLQTKLNLQTTN